MLGGTDADYGGDVGEAPPLPIETQGDHCHQRETATSY